MQGSIELSARVVRHDIVISRVQIEVTKVPNVKEESITMAKISPLSRA